MPPRQVWMFWFASWVSLGLAVLLLAGHLFAPGLSPETAARLAQDPPPFVWRVPGLLHPTAEGAITGLSLAVSLLMATIGAAGLVVIKRADDELLVRGVARMFALGSTGLLVISMTDSFGVHTFVISIVALCFAMATVPQE